MGPLSGEKPLSRKGGGCRGGFRGTSGEATATGAGGAGAAVHGPDACSGEIADAGAEADATATGGRNAAPSERDAGSAEIADAGGEADSSEIGGPDSSRAREAGARAPRGSACERLAGASISASMSESGHSCNLCLCCGPPTSRFSLCCFRGTSGEATATGEGGAGAAVHGPDADAPGTAGGTKCGGEKSLQLSRCGVALQFWVFRSRECAEACGTHRRNGGKRHG